MNCGTCCTIELKISNFYPKSPYQQAGLLLFYSDTINSNKYLRLSYFKGHEKDTTFVSSFLYDFNSEEYQRTGHSKRLGLYPLPNPFDTASITKSIWLQVMIKNGRYWTKFKRNGDHLGYHVNEGSLGSSIQGYDLDLPSPKIIAFGAWQGHSTPNTWDGETTFGTVDVISATFETLIINPCDD